MIGGGAAVRNDGGGSNGVLKKGPWTASEDAILIDYVKKHGEGNWNAVQRNTALQRCGKSCRLRWANHLRPNLKKGAFSQDEERLISEMHSKFGNKWARIAAHLPGRTDNEVKNYWNTRVKRRYRQGLPLYPQDLPSSSQPPLHHPPPTPPPPPPPLPSFSYLKTSLPNPSLSLFDFPISVSYPTSLSSLYHPPPPPLQHRHAEPQPPISIQNQFLCQSDCSPTMDSFELNPDGDLGFDGSVTTNIQNIQMIEQLEGFSNNPCCGSDFEIYNSELPLNQITSGQNLSDAAEVADLSKIIRVSPGLERNNSGLLDALLEEARQKGMSDNLKRESCLDSDPQWHKISSSEISYGEFKKEKPEPEPESGQDHVTSMKEDLSNFLELIPCLVRAPEWCNDNGETSMGQSSISSDDNNGPEMAPVPSFPVVGASSMEEDVWNPGSYTWNNLPRIC